MNLAVSDWHNRFSIQARWTLDLRRHLFDRAKINSNSRILEVGSGTGALLGDINIGERQVATGEFFGLDLNFEYLLYNQTRTPEAKLVKADALRSPFAAGTFDLVFCHFMLLWVDDPQKVVIEMKRLARVGGWVCAFAEPDYGGRIDYPESLAQLGAWQEESLRRQGANTRLGRRLGALFSHARLKNVETGVLGGQWHFPLNNEFWESEWKILMADLSAFVPRNELDAIKINDFQAYQQGDRVLFVPTFYAWGQVEVPDI